MSVPKIPSDGYLNLLVIMIKNCKRETGTNLVSYLETFVDTHLEVDLDNDTTLQKAISKYRKEQYPPKETPALTPDDDL